MSARQRTMGVQAGMAESADAEDLKFSPSHVNLSDIRNGTNTLIDNFIKSRRDGLSPLTLKTYRSYLSHSTEVIGVTVTGDKIQSFISTRSCSNGGKHSYFRTLRAFYRWLYSPRAPLGLDVRNNPFVIVSAPKVEKRLMPSLTPPQIDYLIDRAPCARDRAIISLFADSGLRLNELATIAPQNIDWQRRLIRVWCKGQREGLAPFGTRTEMLLRQWLAEYRANGCIWDVNKHAIVWMLRKLESETGLKCNPHSFRRSFACELARRGVSDINIMRLGRWESISMVDRYTKSVKFEDSLKLYSAIVS